MSAELALRTDLSACEEIIARGLKSFVEVGTALMAIRDGKLYRASYPTFEAYCEDRWGFSRPRAYQLIEGAETTRALSTKVDTPLPTSERQARALTGLEPEQAAEVMAEAHQATNGKPTAADIGAARLRLAPPPKPKVLHPAEHLDRLRTEAPDLAERVDSGDLDLYDACVALEDRKTSIRADNFIFGTIIPQLYGTVHDPEAFLATYDPADNPNAKSAHMLFTPEALHGMADQLHKLAALMEKSA